MNILLLAMALIMAGIGINQGRIVWDEQQAENLATNTLNQEEISVISGLIHAVFMEGYLNVSGSDFGSVAAGTSLNVIDPALVSASPVISGMSLGTQSFLPDGRIAKIWSSSSGANIQYIICITSTLFNSNQSDIINATELPGSLYSLQPETSAQLASDQGYDAHFNALIDQLVQQNSPLWSTLAGTSLLYVGSGTRTIAGTVITSISLMTNGNTTVVPLFSGSPQNIGGLGAYYTASTSVNTGFFGNIGDEWIIFEWQNNALFQ